MRNLVHFNASSGKSENVYFDTYYFFRKYAMFELKKYRGVVSRKVTYGFKNDMK